MMIFLSLFLLFAAPLQSETLPNVSFNRLDLEPRNDSGTAALLDHRFLEPHLDHQAFASRYLNDMPPPPEEEGHSYAPDLYSFEDVTPKSDRSDDQSMLAHMNLHSQQEADTLLNRYQEEALAAIDTESKEFVASNWEQLVDDAVSFLSRLPSPFYLEPHEILSPFLATESLIPEPKLYITMTFMLLPVALLARRKRQHLKKQMTTTMPLHR